MELAEIGKKGSKTVPLAAFQPPLMLTLSLRLGLLNLRIRSRDERGLARSNLGTMSLQPTFGGRLSASFVNFKQRAALPPRSCPKQPLD
jgi:hypothetical protein